MWMWMWKMMWMKKKNPFFTYPTRYSTTTYQQQQRCHWDGWRAFSVEPAPHTQTRSVGGDGARTHAKWRWGDDDNATTDGATVSARLPKRRWNIMVFTRTGEGRARRERTTKPSRRRERHTGGNRLRARALQTSAGTGRSTGHHDRCYVSVGPQ